MREENRLADENNIKVLFFILTRINGKSKRITMNTEVLEDD
jgi:hypothetical protein